MKRLSIWQKLYHARISKRRRISRIRRDKRMLQARGVKTTEIKNNAVPLHAISVYRRGKIRNTFARERITLPENFCLSENYDAVTAFLAQLRLNLNASGQRLEDSRLEGGIRKRAKWGTQIVESYADFATIKRITPITALVLASEYDRAITYFKAPDWLRAVNVASWEPDVFSTLNDVGFLSLLGVDKEAQVAERDGIITVPFLSGSKVHGVIIDRMIRTMATLADSSGLVQDSDTLLMRSRVYDGLGEAIQNVWDHAYPLGAFHDYPVAKKWWMTGAVEPAKKRFTVAIYDHGISIPVSLPSWKKYGEFRLGFAKKFGAEYDSTDERRDGEAIAHAVQLGRTSTGNAWHGKGLNVIRTIVDNCRDGTVRILSRRGHYSYVKGGKTSYITNGSPIAGTLIEWDLLL